MTDDAWLHLTDARIVLVVLANRGAGRGADDASARALAGSATAEPSSFEP